MPLFTKLKAFFHKKESKDILGLAFRPQSLAFCHLSEEGDASYENIPVNAEHYSEALESLKVEYNLSGHCHIVLAASMYQIVQVDKPNVPEEEVSSALKWQIKGLVQFAPENMVVDYFDAPGVVGSSEKINVVCASLSDIKAMVEQLNHDGFSVKSISTEEFAFASLVPVTDDACLLVCQQPNEEVMLLIIKQGKIYFYRRLRGFIEIAHRSEAELAMSVIDALSLEIQRSTDYFERQLKQAPIKNIKIILPVGTESFIARKLAENTNIPVNLLELGDIESASLKLITSSRENVSEGIGNLENSAIAAMDEVDPNVEMNNKTQIDRGFAAALGVTMLNRAVKQHGVN